MKNIPTFESFLNEGQGSFQAFEIDDHINDMHNRVLKMQRQAKTQPEKKILSTLLNEINRFDAVVGELSADWETLHESDSIDEATKVDDSKYVRAHGKKPKGNGMWGFEIKDQEVFTPTSMSYADAQKWAKEEAKRLGASYVYTLG
jgi:hypothetical protein